MSASLRHLSVACALTGLGGCNAEALGFLAARPEPEPERVEPGPVPFPPPPDSAIGAADTWYAECGPATFPMDDLLAPMADAIARQHIPYSRKTPDEWRDCSGSFLRLASYVASACPRGADALPAPPGVAHYAPDRRNVIDLVARARSSRDLARWFHEQGRLVPVFYDPPAAEAVDTAADDDGLPPGLAAVRHLIKPGAVLWFSKGEPLADKGVDQLFSKLGSTRVHHLGVVVDVERDEDGEVVGYSMFHGRNPELTASVTHQHHLEGAGGGPPFGNGDQHLVAIAALLPPAPPPGSARPDPPGQEPGSPAPEDPAALDPAVATADEIPPDGVGHDIESD